MKKKIVIYEIIKETLLQIQRNQKMAEIKQRCKEGLVHVLSASNNKKVLGEENISEFIEKIEKQFPEAGEGKKSSGPKPVLGDYLQNICEFIAKEKKVYIVINVYGFVRANERPKLAASVLEPAIVGRDKCDCGIELYATCDREGKYEFHNENEKSKYNNTVEIMNKWYENNKNPKTVIYVEGGPISPKNPSKAVSPMAQRPIVNYVPRSNAKSYEQLPAISSIPKPGGIHMYPATASKMDPNSEFVVAQKATKIPPKKPAPAKHVTDYRSGQGEPNPFGMPIQRVLNTLNKMEVSFKEKYINILSAFEEIYHTEIVSNRMSKTEAATFIACLHVINAGAISSGISPDVTLRYFKTTYGDFYQNPEKYGETLRE